MPEQAHVPAFEVGVHDCGVRCSCGWWQNGQSTKKMAANRFALHLAHPEHEGVFRHDEWPANATLAPVDDGKHECPYIPCERRVSLQYFACRAHWMKVPADLRAALYAAFDGRGGDYLEVRDECVKAMNAR